MSFNLRSVLVSPKESFIYLDNADCSLMSSNSFSKKQSVIAQYFLEVGDKNLKQQLWDGI